MKSFVYACFFMAFTIAPEVASGQKYEGTQNAGLNNYEFGELSFGVSSGYYRIKEIDRGLYERHNNQLTYVASGRFISPTDALSLTLLVAYTFNDFSLSKLPDGTLAAPITLKKEMGIVDIGTQIGYNVLKMDEGNAFVALGYRQGILVDGGNEKKGIYSSPIGCIKCSTSLFNDTFHTMTAGIGLNHFPSDHLGLELRLEYSKTFGEIEVDTKRDNLSFNGTLALIYRL